MSICYMALYSRGSSQHFRACHQELIHDVDPWRLTLRGLLNCWKEQITAHPLVRLARRLLLFLLTVHHWPVLHFVPAHLQSNLALRLPPGQNTYLHFQPMAWRFLLTSLRTPRLETVSAQQREIDPSTHQLCCQVAE
jgi:hypothetical protein